MHEASLGCLHENAKALFKNPVQGQEPPSTHGSNLFTLHMVRTVTVQLPV